MPAEPILELGSTMLNPAIDRGVIDAHAPLLKHFLKVSIADLVMTPPTHRPKNDFAALMMPFITIRHCNISGFLQSS
jgi:hypothetical protein